MIFSVLKVPLNKNQGGYWGKQLPKVPLVIVPFDIVIKHKERWQYLNRIRISELDSVYLLSSSKTPTTCLYCIRTKCIYDRLVPLLHVNPARSHEKVIKEQLNVLLQIVGSRQVDNRNQNLFCLRCLL